MRAGLAGICLLALLTALALRFGAVTDLDATLAMQLRLPRVLAAAAVGAGLALGGAVLQTLFGNPLAEPYTLGISSGATLGAVAGLSLERVLGPGAPALLAFVGATVFGATLVALSWRRGLGTAALLLAGVMLGFFGSSLVALWMALADPQGVTAAVYWLMGDLSRVGLRGATAALVAVLALGAVVWRQWPTLDGLLTGEESAHALGLPVAAARRVLLVAVAMLVGICVSAAGMVGFVGLVVPHFARMVAGSLHRRLLPVAAIGGAALLIGADLLARAAAAPRELPVGVVTALIGVPAYLWLSLRGDRRLA